MNKTTTAKETTMNISNTNQMMINRNRIEIERQLLDIECMVVAIRERMANDDITKIMGEPELGMTHRANNLMVMVMELHSRISTNAGIIKSINNQVGA
jgi:hypothetical protein